MVVVSPSPFLSIISLLKAVYAVFYPGDYSVSQFFQQYGGWEYIGWSSWKDGRSSEHLWYDCCWASPVHFHFCMWQGRYQPMACIHWRNKICRLTDKQVYQNNRLEYWHFFSSVLKVIKHVSYLPSLSEMQTMFMLVITFCKLLFKANTPVVLMEKGK